MLQTEYNGVVDCFSEQKNSDIGLVSGVLKKYLNKSEWNANRQNNARNVSYWFCEQFTALSLN